MKTSYFNSSFHFHIYYKWTQQHRRELRLSRFSTLKVMNGILGDRMPSKRRKEFDKLSKEFKGRSK